MKFLTLIFTFIFSFNAMAHTDHALGDGAFHYLYHIAFFAICCAVAVKAFKWFKSRKSSSIK